MVPVPTQETTVQIKVPWEALHLVGPLEEDRIFEDGLHVEGSLDDVPSTNYQACAVSHSPVLLDRGKHLCS